MQLTKTRTYTRTLYLGSPCLFHCIGKDSSRVMAVLFIDLANQQKREREHTRARAHTPTRSNLNLRTYVRRRGIKMCVHALTHTCKYEIHLCTYPHAPRAERFVSVAGAG
jgi:hypothetical protein